MARFVGCVVVPFEAKPFLCIRYSRRKVRGACCSASYTRRMRSTDLKVHAILKAQALNEGCKYLPSIKPGHLDEVLVYSVPCGVAWGKGPGD